MGAILIIGGIAALLFFAHRSASPGNPAGPGTALGNAIGAAETVVGGAVHGTVKLGNADPNFESWLATEMQQIFGAPSNVAGHTQKDYGLLETSIRNRRIGSLAYGTTWTEGYWKNVPGDCGSASGSGLSTISGVRLGAGLASQGADALNTGLGLAGTAEKVANAVPIVGSILSTITSVLSGIFAHHAQAVAREQSTLCAVIPQVNAFLDQIDQAYTLGQLSGPQAVQALETIYTQMNQGLAAIEKPTGCNASCVYLRELRGIIDAKSLFDY